MKNVNVSEVLKKMPYRENITLKTIRFPKTAQGIYDSFASVSDFEHELGTRLYKMPIGDDISLAIIK